MINEEGWGVHGLFFKGKRELRGSMNWGSRLKMWTSQTQKGTSKVQIQHPICYRGLPSPRPGGALPGKGFLYLSRYTLPGATPEVQGEGWHTNWVNYFRASLPYHPPSHWKGMTNDRVALSFRNVCRLYDVEGENVVTELKVFHSSYALPPSNVKDVLKCLKDMMWNQFSLVWLCF